MAAKKKPKKKQTKAKRTSPRKLKAKPVRKPAKKKLATKRKAPNKKSAKKAAPKKSVAKPKPSTKKAVRPKQVNPSRKRVQATSRSVKTEPFLQEAQTRRSSVQAGDLQGLSNAEGAASESVDELLEEGNAFEADVVSGVEDADNSDEKEVHTHEVPEDDVPGEYLDEE